MQIYFENYSKNTAFSRELSLVSATKLRFMGSYPDALTLRSANTTFGLRPEINVLFHLCVNFNGLCSTIAISPQS